MIKVKISRTYYGLSAIWFLSIINSTGSTVSHFDECLNLVPIEYRKYYYEYSEAVNDLMKLEINREM